MECIQGLLKAGKKHLAQKFNFTYSFINDNLSLNILKISEFIDVFLRELEIKDTADSNTSAAYSRTSMARTLMARLPRLFQTRY